MSLADGMAWEQEFGVSEASKAADAALRASSPVAHALSGPDPMGVFPRPSPTPASAADVPCYRRDMGAADVPFMPTVEMTADLRQQIDAQRQNYIQVATPKIEMLVYLDNGVVFSYEVTSISAAREHADAIIKTGYRSVQADQPDVLTHFPPHRILKVKVKANGTPFKTNYFDKATGT